MKNDAGPKLQRALDADLEREIHDACLIGIVTHGHRRACGAYSADSSAPSYTVRPDSFTDDMHAIQRDLKR